MLTSRHAVLQGGPLGDKRYRLDHFHFHWGGESTRGAEHTVNGGRSAAEVSPTPPSLLAQFSLYHVYVHKGGLKPHSFNLICSLQVSRYCMLVLRGS